MGLKLDLALELQYFGCLFCLELECILSVLFCFSISQPIWKIKEWLTDRKHSIYCISQPQRKEMRKNVMIGPADWFLMQANNAQDFTAKTFTMYRGRHGRCPGWIQKRNRHWKSSKLGTRASCPKPSSHKCWSSCHWWVFYLLAVACCEKRCNLATETAPYVRLLR